VTDRLRLQEQQALERARLDAKNSVASAQARTPGEWLDIYRSIVEQGVRQVLEENDAGGVELSCRLKAIAPHFDRVRSGFESHGLPLLEDIEVEGGRILTNPNGIDEGLIFDDPSAPEVRFYWPGEGSNPKPLCFQGQTGIVALTFIRWWVGFHQVAIKQAGQEKVATSRIIQPGSNDYLRYLFGK
jgi:hypothetical protein